ncbi:MAG: hypothetical protein AAB665_02685, partial [Patescibacteria group bacterium]
MSRTKPLSYIFCAAVFLIPFYASAQDIEITFEPSFQVEHAGFILYNGNPVDPSVFPDAVTVRSSELTSVDGEWVVEELLTWFRNVPQSRGVYILTRIDPDTFALEGGVPIRGENYDLVHVAFSESATSTHTFTFSLPFLGDAAIPSGTYMFFAAELPETKSVYDPATDTDTTSPYTDDDLAAWLADRSSQDTFGPDAYTEAAIFEYVNDGPPPCTEDCFSNVLFLPGIMGSKLYENGEQLWDGTDEQVRRLYLDEGGASESEGVYTKDVIDVFTAAPVINVPIYEAFLEDLAQKKADGAIEDYAAVPYDWRLSIPDILENGKEESPGEVYYSRATSTPYIEQELRRLAADSRTGKVTIIGHSNGGLVAKALISRLGNEAAELVDRLILVGVPQIGTPKAVGALLHGFDTGIPFVLSDERARDFANTAPLIYQLLPDSDYYQNAGASITTPLVTFDAGSATQAYIDAYGLAVGNAEELHSFLIGEEGRTQPAYDDIVSPAVGRESLLNAAEELKALIGSSWQAPAGITVHQIAGIGENTLAGITYKTVRECTNVVISFNRPICTTYEDRISYTPNEVVDGDGTVVVPSALAMSETDGVKRWWVNLDNYNKILGVPVPSVIRKNHKNLLEVQELRTFIFENLIEETSALLPENISSSGPALTNTHHLRFVLHSPLTLSATDSSGNTINADVATIPGATYAEYGEVQVITVPSDSNPTLTLNGIAAGTFALEVEEYKDGTLVDSATFMGVPSTANTVASLSFTDGTLASAGNLAIDYDGDGAVDVELPAGGDVMYEDFVAEEEDVPETPASQSQSGGGGGNGPIVATVATATLTSTSTPETMITATATSSAENATTSVSVQEAEPKVIVAKTVAADVVKPDTNTQEAESDIIETVVEQPQVA